jgi:hypothetical protein
MVPVNMTTLCLHKLLHHFFQLFLTSADQLIHLQTKKSQYEHGTIAMSCYRKKKTATKTWGFVRWAH